MSKLGGRRVLANGMPRRPGGGRPAGSGPTPANLWGFAVYLASRDGYEDSVLPSGLPIGEPEAALDCACGLYLNDPTAWQEHLPPATP